MQISVREAARLLSVSEKTIYRWLKDGRLPGYRIGGVYRFHRAELLEWATARRLAVAPELLGEPRGPEGALPSLAEALRAGGVHYRVGGTDKASVLGAVVEAMRLPEEVDRTFVRDVLLARERLGSTALGEGIAIPHPRSPVVLHLAGPTVTLCFLEHPIDFGALDGRPVDTLFTLVSPTVRAHLHLLGRLGFVLRDPGVRRLLSQRGSREALLEAFDRAESAIPAPKGGRP